MEEMTRYSAIHKEQSKVAPEVQLNPYEVVIDNPYEKLVYDLVDNIKNDWTGHDVRVFVTDRLKLIAQQQRDAGDVYGALNA